MNMYRFKILDTRTNKEYFITIIARTWQDARGQITLENYEKLLDN